MDTDIICTIIQTLGTLGAAIGTALIAKKVVKEDLKPIFQSYSDKSYNLSRLIRKAEHNIVIMGSSGYRILKDYGHDIKEKLNNGVSVYYLFLNEQQLWDMERYRHGDDKINEEIYSYVKEKLAEWDKEYNNEQRKQLHIREFPEFMTAAYVGVDIPFGEESGWHIPDSVIQVVLYQYGNSAKDSPLSYLCLKRDRKHFYGTLDSMTKMWEKSEEFSKKPSDQK